MKAYGVNELSVYNATSSNILEKTPVFLRLGVIHLPQRVMQTEHLDNDHFQS